MSINNDYALHIVANQKVKDFQAEAANDRLVRIAQTGRGPWWRRLFVQPGAVQTDGLTAGHRSGKFHLRGLRVGAHHVAP